MTPKQKVLACIRGEKLDEYVNQFEYVKLAFDPATLFAMGNVQKGGAWKNGWGVQIEFPENVPGMFPNTSPEYVVVDDVTKWKEKVHMPRTEFTDEEWAPTIEQVNAIDREQYFVAPFIAPGIFEKLHYLMGMEECMINFYDEPEAMHELIDYLVEYEIKVAKEVIDHFHPDALFHHDDWGSQKSSFLSPEMFDEFLLPAYEKIYGYWKANGVELIIHHSDSYGANLVPSMIKMGIDIWQGCMYGNDIPKLIKTYGGQISFQGGIDNGKVDRGDWTKEYVEAETRKVISEVNSKNYFIPATVMGEPGSVFPGVYDFITEVIDAINRGGEVVHNDNQEITKPMTHFEK